MAESSTVKAYKYRQEISQVRLRFVALFESILRSLSIHFMVVPYACHHLQCEYHLKSLMFFCCCFSFIVLGVL